MFAQFRARFCHQRIRFGAAFADARFVAVAAMFADDQRAQFISFTELAQPAEGVNEAYPVHAHLLYLAGANHHQSHQIVRQGDHQEFFVNPLHRLAPQHFQVQSLLQVPQVHFDLPPVAIQLREFCRRILLRIEQRRDQRYLPRAAAGLADREPQLGERGSKRGARHTPQPSSSRAAAAV